MCATRRALEQLAESNERVTLETLNLVLDKEKAAEYGVDRVPAIIVVGARVRSHPLLRRAARAMSCPRWSRRFAMVGDRETPSERAEPGASCKTLSRPVRLQVFFTPTCVYCPQMISLANQLAVASPLVSAMAIDATEYPDLVRRYNVNGVPKTMINDRIEIMGAVTEEELVMAMTDQLRHGLQVCDWGLGSSRGRAVFAVATRLSAAAGHRPGAGDVSRCRFPRRSIIGCRSR